MSRAIGRATATAASLGIRVWKNLTGGQQRVEADMQRLFRDGVPVDAV